MRCQACQGETPDGKSFCANCGARLAATCGSCGAALTPGQRFCADCGAATSAPAAPAAPVVAVATAERRLCSVLFVDLVGFTPFAEKRDPEEVRELLSRYFDRARAIIENYGGTLEKFIGDAVMAVWGAPSANEDDAERAVRAALDVVTSVADLGREAGYPDLRARGGVVTGEVAITIGKVSEGMVLGDTVNSASRVQSVAEPGSVLVDEATWRASSDAIAFESVGSLTLKGKDEVVVAWRALRVVGQRKGIGRSTRLEPPFVGRDEEFRLVRDLLHATTRERRARLVSVTGVPGIGKSRLAWEFLKYVDGLAETVYWHQGRSVSYGEGAAFGALGEMVRMRAGIAEAEDADESRAKLRASVAQFVTDETERRWVEPRLAHLLGLADAPTGERDELFNAWRTFFERISDVGTAVMVFEDLQWADPGLIDFVESILEWSRSFPVMVVTLSRPELLDLRPDWGAGQRSFASVHLEPLDDGAMRALLAGVVTGLPDSVTELILARAEGVPLYAVETLRMLVDRGVIVERDGVYSVEGDATTLDIPETLQALVTSRLDALSADQRALLQDAAVLGASFLPESLAAVSGVERSAIEASLRDLVRREFLHLDTDPRSPERGQYGFVQAVIADVALSMLSRRDLNAKHLVAARYYEGFDDDELTPLVASHYVAAYRAAPEGERDEALAESARSWLARAAERVQSLGSSSQALALYEQALAITTGPSRAPLLEAASMSASLGAENERAHALATEAVGIHREAGDANAAANATVALARVLFGMHRLEEGAALAIATYEELGEDGDLTARTRLAQNAATALAQSGQSELGLVWAERALALAERLDSDEDFLNALGARSYSLFHVGRHQEAVLLAEGALAIALASDSLRSQLQVSMALSLYCLPDDVRRSYVASRETAELGRRAGARAFEQTATLNAIEDGIWLGLWVECEEMIADVRSKVLPDNEHWVDMLECMLAAWRGDLVRGRELLQKARSAPNWGEHVASQTTGLTAESLFSYFNGDFAESLGFAERAVELDPTGINVTSAIARAVRAAAWMRDLEGLSRALAATAPLRGRFIAALRLETRAAIAGLEGRADESGELFDSAVEAWRLVESMLDVATTEMEALHVLGPGHPTAVMAKEAEDLFTEYGVAVLLERLREDLAR